MSFAMFGRVSSGCIMTPWLRPHGSLWLQNDTMTPSPWFIFGRYRLCLKNTWELETYAKTRIWLRNRWLIICTWLKEHTPGTKTVNMGYRRTFWWSLHFITILLLIIWWRSLMIPIQLPKRNQSVIIDAAWRKSWSMIRPSSSRMIFLSKRRGTDGHLGAIAPL